MKKVTGLVWGNLLIAVTCAAVAFVAYSYRSYFLMFANIALCIFNFGMAGNILANADLVAAPKESFAVTAPKKSEIRGTLTKPWKRGTYGIDMVPHKGFNFTGSFCKTCGDWVTDHAYYQQHYGSHRALKGSWNREMPHMKRADPDDIKPNHEEWLEDIRVWASKSTGLLGGTGIPVMPGYDCAFHSQKEADDTLNPYGLRTYWCENSGWVQNGHAQGAWAIARLIEKPVENFTDETLQLASAAIDKAAGSQP